MTINPFRFVLVGSLEGKTINLGGHQFVDGVFEMTGPEPHIAPSETDAKLKAEYLAKTYQAFPEGSQALEEARARLKNDEAPPGEVDLEKREREQQDEQQQREPTERARQGAIRTAIAKLDPENDEHWTSQGLPSVEVVRTLAEDDKVSRADISNLAPNLTREEAKKAAAGGDPLDS